MTRAAPRARRSGSRISIDRLRRPVLGSALIALVLRVLYLIDAAGNPFRRELGLDLEIYHEWAQAIARGQAPSGPFLQAPLYPYLLSISYRILGPDPVRALWFQLIPGVLSVAAISWAAGRWRGPLAAWIGGMLAAIYAPALFYTGVLLPPTWALFLSTLLLVLGVEMLRGSARPALPLAAGLAAGLLALAQPVALALALPLLFFAPSGPGATSRSGRIAMLGGLVAPLLITFLFNGSRGAWTPIAVNGGINLYIGNGPQATGGYAPPPGMEENRDILGIEIARTQSRSSERAGARAGDAGAPDASSPASNPSPGSDESQDFSVSDADRYWRREALSAMARDPGRTVALFARKMLLFFGQYEVPQIESFGFERRYSSLLRIPLPGMALLVALGLFGAIACARDRIARWLALSAVCFAVATALFFVTARFRLPIVPWLAVLASVGVVQAVELIRERRLERRSLLAGGAALLAALLLSANLLGIDAEAARGQYAFRLGVVAESAGRTAEAVDHYREALEADSTLAKANVNLGTLLARQGNLEEALPYLEAGAKLDPGSGTALQNLGQAYQVLGRDAEALAQFEKAVLAQPELVSARESLAYLRYASGEIDEARQGLRTIASQAPRGSPPALRAGTLLAIIDERTELVRRLAPAERAAGADPEWWKHASLLRADLALAQRKLTEARLGYERASNDPAVAPYARDVLRQMTESLGASAP